MPEDVTLSLAVKVPVVVTETVADADTVTVSDAVVDGEGFIVEEAEGDTLAVNVGVAVGETDGDGQDTEPAGLPAGHGPLQKEDSKPPTAPNVPAGHKEQLPAPAKLYCPGGHCEHCVEEVDPVAFTYLPAAQGVQTSRPPTAPYRPPGHARQVATEVAAVKALKVPTGHAVHVETDAAQVALEYVPFGQAVQELTPTTAP